MYQYVVLLAMICLYGFNNQEVINSSAPINISTVDTTQSPLVMYGAQIFKDKKCQRCHKLDEDGKKRLKSLDGLGGKYPDIWLYSFLQDPESFIPKTRMPSLESLFKKEIDKNRLDKILLQSSENITIEQLELSWQKLQEDVNELKSNLQKDLPPGTEILSTEGLALMAFLQKIPSSKK
ncbi:MAG TPA: cbb3-type cytochrome c oxidase subunit II [Saprospiraceae bacterium]|nr:cbb3-type cytochrome c oxidase subunit II [Saprospiraceae bacterium]